MLNTVNTLLAILVLYVLPSCFLKNMKMLENSIQRHYNLLLEDIERGD